MRLYASEVCACRGAHPTTGMVRLGIEQCGRCWKLRAGTGDEVVQPPRQTLLHDAEDDDGRSTPSVERGARQSRFHGRPNISMRQYLAGLEE